MANLRTDSPLSRRIVLAFLDFLSSVEPAPGVDLEGLEVARECLEEVFKLDSCSVDVPRPNLLVDFFSSLEADKHHESKSDLDHESMSADVPMPSSVQNANATSSGASKLPKNEDGTEDPQVAGMSKDSLFEQFCGALERIHFLKGSSIGTDDHDKLAKAKRIFDDALKEMEKSGCQVINIRNLAEALKSQGNQAMQAKLYVDGIELYTFAIALCGDNAVYYCNRAAAFTQINKYSEAIEDCNKSIEIDPNYSKAYSRLGLAYYAQGNYSDAISKGFMKALRLDPNNSSIRENILVSEQKLEEELQQRERDQNAGQSHRQEPTNSESAGSRNRGPSFASMPFNGTLPADFANVLMNMAAGAYNGQQAHDIPPEGVAEGSNEPEIRIGGNISVSFGEGEVPEQITGTWRSVMEMFSSAHDHQGDDTNRGSAPN